MDTLANRETEVKLRVNDDKRFIAAIHKLVEKRADYRNFVLETNSIFDNEDRDLKQKRQVLRIRHCKSPRGWNNANAELTFKDKGSRERGISSRTELNVRIDPDRTETMEDVLVALGYRRTFTYQKYRKTYLFMKCKVELDELPLIGKFIEIEGPNADEIEQVIQELGLDDLERVESNYIKLLKAEIKRFDLPFPNAMFPDNEG